MNICLIYVGATTCWRPVSLIINLLMQDKALGRKMGVVFQFSITFYCLYSSTFRSHFSLIINKIKKWNCWWCRWHFDGYRTCDPERPLAELGVIRTSSFFPPDSRPRKMGLSLPTTWSYRSPQTTPPPSSSLNICSAYEMARSPGRPAGKVHSWAC